MYYAALNAKIIYYDPFLSPERAQLWRDTIPASHLQVVDNIDEMLPMVDVLSLHVPLLDSTRDLISYDHLRKLKASAILVNTARGGVVNEDALIDALERGTILGAGVDAFSVEPPTMENFSKLISHPRVIST